MRRVLSRMPTGNGIPISTCGRGDEQHRQRDALRRGEALMAARMIGGSAKIPRIATPRSRGGRTGWCAVAVACADAPADEAADARAGQVRKTGSR